MVPKNSGLKKYREIALSLLDISSSRIIEVRGEDVPYWVNMLREKGRKAIGLTGEDLFREAGLNLKILKRIEWNDADAKFGKPALCLLGPKGSDLTDMPKQMTVCICSKYKKMADEYLASLEGYSFKKIYVNGCVELGCSEGIAELIIDIVYSGSSMEKYGLRIYDILMESDFLIIGGNNEA